MKKLILVVMSNEAEIDANINLFFQSGLLDSAAAQDYQIIRISEELSQKKSISMHLLRKRLV